MSMSAGRPALSACPASSSPSSARSSTPTSLRRLRSTRLTTSSTYDSMSWVAVICAYSRRRLAVSTSSCHVPVSVLRSARPSGLRT